MTIARLLRRWMPLLPLTLALALAAAACQPDTVPANGGGERADDAREKTTVETDPGIFHFGTTDPFGLFPPADYPGSVVSQVYLSLSALIIEESGEGTYQYPLTEKIEPVDGGCRFTLKKNLPFSDGSPVTPDDIAYSVETTAAGKAGWYFQFAQSVACETIGTDTVECLSPRPVDCVRDFGFAVFKKGTEKTGFPVGSGPYMPDKVDPAAQTVTLKRNPRFPFGTPHFHHLVVHFYPDAEAQMVAFLAGTIDFIANVSPLNARFLTAGGTFPLIRIPPPKPIVLHINVRRSPLNEPGFRRALSLLLDRKQLNRQVPGGESFMTYDDRPLRLVAYAYARKSGALAPETHTAAESGFSFPGSDDHAKYDPKRGQKLLFALGYRFDEKKRLVDREGRQVSFTLDPQPKMEPSIVRWLLSSWRSAGMDVAVGRFWESEDMREHARQTDRWDVAVGYQLEYQALYKNAPHYVTGGDKNVYGFSSKRIDRLFAEAALEKEKDPAALFDTARRLRSALSEDSPRVLVAYRYSICSVGARFPMGPYLGAQPFSLDNIWWGPPEVENAAENREN